MISKKFWSMIMLSSDDSIFSSYCKRVKIKNFHWSGFLIQKWKKMLKCLAKFVNNTKDNKVWDSLLLNPNLLFAFFTISRMFCSHISLVLFWKGELGRLWNNRHFRLFKDPVKSWMSQNKWLWIRYTRQQKQSTFWVNRVNSKNFHLLHALPTWFCCQSKSVNPTVRRTITNTAPVVYTWLMVLTCLSSCWCNNK